MVPLFVVDPAFAEAGEARLSYMSAALQGLDRATGDVLVYRHGRPADVVPALAAELSAAAVFVTRDHTPYGRRRDAMVAESLRGIGCRLVGVDSNYAVAPGTVAKSDGTAYQVFTPFSKAWRAVGWSAPVPAPEVNWRGHPDVACDGPPATPARRWPLSPGDETAAHARWNDFLPEVQHYAGRRDLPALDATSRLSAALRWGLLHPRQLLDDLGPGEEHRVFVNEIAWREFYADVLHRSPDSAWQNLNRKMDAMPVDTDADAHRRFERWCAGATGYPVVDAGMRQLLATGWMHNRVRMIVASFLVKDLHLPWQWGARHFMRHLVDGDLASNQHGWQWTAGTGTDAAPYFRVFNPTSQGLRYDPQGDYVRTWVPELAGIAGAAVHEPGGARPVDYPAPMVDHAVERDEALRRYRQVTAGSR